MRSERATDLAAIVEDMIAPFAGAFREPGQGAMNDGTCSGDHEGQEIQETRIPGVPDVEARAASASLSFTRDRCANRMANCIVGK